MSNNDEDCIKMLNTVSDCKSFDYYWEIEEKLNYRERRINLISWRTTTEDVRVNYRLSKFNKT